MVLETEQLRMTPHARGLIVPFVLRILVERRNFIDEYGGFLDGILSIVF